MTARDIQRAISVQRYRRSFVMLNYTPIGWFECDVFEITEAGFMVEYEIKLSKSDFKADAKKAKGSYAPVAGKILWQRVDGPSKHSRITQGDEKGPARFYFVIPVTLANRQAYPLVSLDDIPEWAGVMGAILRSNHEYVSCWNRVHLQLLRPAPKLHKAKADSAVRRKAVGTCYWRMHNLFLDGAGNDLAANNLPNPQWAILDEPEPDQPKLL